MAIPVDRTDRINTLAGQGWEDAVRVWLASHIPHDRDAGARAMPEREWARSEHRQGSRGGLRVYRWGPSKQEKIEDGENRGTI